MKKSLPAIVLLLIIVVFFAIARVRSQRLRPGSDSTEQHLADSAEEADQPSDQNAEGCIPAFKDGGGPYYKPNAPMRDTLSPEDTKGTKLSVSGKLLQSDCVTPVANAVLDIWQADENGNYNDEWYRGKVATNDAGEYAFVTVMPKGYQEGTAFRPPHIHVKVWKDDKELLTTQLFLPAAREQGIEDAYIMATAKVVYGASVEQAQNMDADEYMSIHDIILPE